MSNQRIEKKSISNTNSQQSNFEQLVLSLPDVIYSLDSELKFSYVTQKKYKNLLGIDPDYKKSVIKNWEEIIHPDDVKQLHQLQQQIMYSKTYSISLRINLASTETQERWIKVSGVSKKNNQGQVIKSIGSIQDITEEKNLEKALARFGDELFELIDEAGAPIFGFDINGYINEWNKKITEITGYQLDTVIGTPIRDIIMPSNRKAFDDITERILKKSDIGSIEIPLVAADGSEILILASLTPRYDDHDNVVGVIMVGQEITDRKRAQETLARSLAILEDKVTEKTENLRLEKARIEMILESMPDGILVINYQGIITHINSKLDEMYYTNFGMDISKFVGLPYRELPKSKFKRILSKLSRNKQTDPITVKTPKDKHFQITCTLSDPLDNFSQTKSIGNVFTIRDVTTFIEFNNMRKRFVSSVSHELKTPIAVISQSIDILIKYRDRLKPEKEKRFLNTIARNSVLMTDLVSDLLEISRIEDGKIRLRWEKIQPQHIVKEVMNELEPVRKAKETPIYTDIPNGAITYGDKKRLAQVCRIFIDNALKYSEKEDKITIKIIDDYFGKYNTTNVDGILIRVDDTGRGIKQKDIPYLFNRFFRSEDVRDLPGSGLGLSVADELVKLHKGEIFVESEFGKGSSFIVFLPRLPESPQE